VYFIEILKRYIFPPRGYLWYAIILKGVILLKNIEMKVDGNILTITVDLTKDFGPSSSGVPGHDAVKVGLNVFKKK